MNILPVSFAVFKGKEVRFDTSYGASGIKNLPDFHPNSSIEKTIGSHHTYRKDKVYFAAPMEFVSDDIKERVDFVVYDNEPSYPTIEEVRRNYLGTNRTDYRKQFENIREYYYRREMGGFANSNEAKYQQWQSATCTGLYDKAGDLRYKKETAEDEVKALKAEKAAIAEGIETTNNEIAAQLKLKRGIRQHIKTLESLQKPYEDLDEIISKEVSSENKLYAAAKKRTSASETQNEHNLKYGKYENTTATYEALYKAEDESYKLSGEKSRTKFARAIKNTIENFKKILEENGKTIEEMNAYMAELRQKLSSVESQIREKNSFISECKNKLKPLFEELANYYKKQGIKIIKKK